MRLNRSSMSSGYNPQLLSKSGLSRNRLKAKKAFVKWMNKNYPTILNRALKRANLSRSQVGLNGFGLNGLGQNDNGNDNGDSEESWYDSILDTVDKAVPVWAGYEQQRELIKINERRAKQGLEPLDRPPTIRVEGEAGEGTQESIRAGMTEAAGQYMPIAIAGLALTFLMRG